MKFALSGEAILHPSENINTWFSWTSFFSQSGIFISQRVVFSDYLRQRSKRGLQHPQQSVSYSTQMLFVTRLPFSIFEKRGTAVTCWILVVNCSLLRLWRLRAGSESPASLRNMLRQEELAVWKGKIVVTALILLLSHNMTQFKTPAILAQVGKGAYTRPWIDTHIWRGIRDSAYWMWKVTHIWSGSTRIRERQEMFLSSIYNCMI